MMLLLAAIGLFLTCIGGWFVHVFDKKTPILKRLVAVAATMIGIISLWTIIASIAPAVNKVEVTVVSVFEEGMVAELVSTGTRNCRVEEINAFLITKDGSKIPVESKFIYKGRIENSDLGYLVILNPSKYAAESASFTIRHWCPFGFQVNTETTPSALPPVQLIPPVPKETY